MPPTRFPTEMPTWRLDDYESSDIYAHHVGNSTVLNDQSNSIVYSSFYYKGLQIFGTCPEWDAVTFVSLDSPFDDVQFTSVTGVFEIYDYSSRKSRARIATCSKSSEINLMVEALNSGASEDFELPCNDNTWRVFTCAGSRVICVNCKKVCTISETCPGKSYLVSPCLGNCQVHAAASAIVSFAYDVIVLHPQLTEPIAIRRAGRTFIEAMVTTNRGGTVTCRALPSSRVVTALAQVYRRAVPQIHAGPLEASLHNMTGLQPDTDYSVYCVTEAFTSHVMPIVEVLANNATTRTECCKSFFFPVIHPIVPSVNAPVSASAAASEGLVHTFALEAPPIAPMVVRLELEFLLCDNDAYKGGNGALRWFTTISPKTFTFTPQSGALGGNFSIYGYQGCYAVRASGSALSGTGEVEMYFNASSRQIAVVENSKIVMPAPELLSASMTADGMRVIIAFDVGTTKSTGGGDDGGSNDDGSAFSCYSMLRFDGADNALCTWIDDQTLQATLVPYPVVDEEDDYQLAEPGSTLLLLPGIVQAACLAASPCETYPYTNRSSVVISPPAAGSLLVPQVSLTSTSRLAACDVIVLDPTGSSGSGGRPWKHVRWSVSGTAPIALQQSIEQFLNNSAGNTDLLVKLPSEYITPQTHYSFTLELTNFLNVTGVKTTKVFRSNEASRLRVSIYGAAHIETLRTRSLELFAEAELPDCISSGAVVSIYYTWRVFVDRDYNPSIVSQSTDQRFFRLDPFMLQPLTTYTVQVAATTAAPSNRNPVQFKASVTVEVGAAGVKAVIADCAVMRSVRQSSTVVLDASGSFDEDFPADGSAVTFVWSCLEFYPVYGRTCGAVVVVPTDPRSAVFTITAGALQADTVYTVAVAVSNAFGASDVASCRLGVSADDISGSPSTPEVYIDGDLLPEKLSHLDKVILTGIITPHNSSHPGTAAWTSPTLSASRLSAIVNGPLSMTFAAGNTGTVLFELAIRAGVLSSGRKYTFQLSTAFTSQQQATATAGAATAVATVTVVVNQSPLGGAVSVSPDEGMALSTRFFLSTYQWTDDASDLPLTYTFTYYPVTPDTQTLLRISSETATVSAVLGQGVEYYGYAITCVVTAMDVFGGESNATAIAVVRPYAASASVDTVLSGLVDDAVTSRDASSVYQAIGSALTLINAVNCTVPIPCSVLNREECSSTTSTCGPCLSGFIGADGPANRLCAAEDELPKSPLSSVGNACNASAECSSGACSELDGGGGVCLSIDKSCPNDCSGHGTCRFFDILGTAVGNCSVTSSVCYASCACDAEFYGRDCSLTFTELEDLQALRELLCQSLDETVPLEDVTLSALAGRAASIASIFTDDTQINDAAVDTCGKLLIDIIADYADLVCDATVADAVLDAISAILGLRSAIPASLLLDLEAAVSVLASSCQRGLAVGENNFELIRTNVRISTALSSLATVASRQVAVGRTPMERQSGTGQSAVGVQIIDGDGGDEDSSIDASSTSAAVGVTITQYLTNPQGYTTNSSSVVVETAPYGSTAGGSAQLRRRLQYPSEYLPDDPAFPPAGQGSSRIHRLRSSRRHRRLRQMRSVQPLSFLDDASPTRALMFQHQPQRELKRTRRRKLIGGGPTVASAAVGVTITLQNIYSVTYDSLADTERTVECLEWRSQDYRRTMTCPSGLVVDYDCPKYTKGYFKVQCPGHTDTPVCRELTTDSFVDSTDCTVVSFDALSTTCYCTGSTAASATGARSARRRLAERKEHRHHGYALTDAEASESVNPYHGSIAISKGHGDDDSGDSEGGSKSMIKMYGYQQQQQSRRRAADVVGTGLFTAQQFASSVVVERTEFSDSFTRLADPLEVTRNTAIWSTLLAACIMLLIGLVGFVRQDRNEAYEDMVKRAFKTPSKVRTIEGFFDGITPQVCHPDPWKVRFMRNLPFQHQWWALWLSERSGDNCKGTLSISRSQLWILCGSRFLAIIFANTILSFIFFPDDDHCDGFHNESSCNEYTTGVGSWIRGCRWVPRNETCEFRPPDMEFITIFIFLAAATAFVAPVVKLVELCANTISKYSSFRTFKTAVIQVKETFDIANMTGGGGPDSFKVRRQKELDELQMVQTPVIKLQLAARLRRQQRIADLVLPSVEVEGILVRLESTLPQFFQSHSLAAAAAAAAGGAGSTSLWQDQHELPAGDRSVTRKPRKVNSLRRGSWSASRISPRFSPTEKDPKGSGTYDTAPPYVQGPAGYGPAAAGDGGGAAAGSPPALAAAAPSAGDVDSSGSKAAGNSGSGRCVRHASLDRVNATDSDDDDSIEQGVKGSQDDIFIESSGNGALAKGGAACPDNASVSASDGLHHDSAGRKHSVHTTGPDISAISMSSFDSYSSNGSNGSQVDEGDAAAAVGHRRKSSRKDSYKSSRRSSRRSSIKSSGASDPTRIPEEDSGALPNSNNTSNINTSVQSGALPNSSNTSNINTSVQSGALPNSNNTSNINTSVQSGALPNSSNTSNINTSVQSGALPNSSNTSNINTSVQSGALPNSSNTSNINTSVQSGALPNSSNTSNINTSVQSGALPNSSNTSNINTSVQSGDVDLDLEQQQKQQLYQYEDHNDGECSAVVSHAHGTLHMHTVASTAAATVAAAARAQAKTSAPYVKLSYLEMWEQSVSSSTLQRARHHLQLDSHDQMYRRMDTVRAKAEALRRELDLAGSSEEQDVLLMKYLLINCFPKHEQSQVRRYLMGHRQPRSISHVQVVQYWVCVCGLLSLLLGMIIVTIMLQLSIGSRATDYWLLLSFLCLAEDIVFLQPLTVLLDTLLWHTGVRSDLYAICRTLKRRYCHILQRRRGLIRDAGALVQHLNPACRAARMLPELPVSRLLIALNDYDIPAFRHQCITAARSYTQLCACGGGGSGGVWGSCGSWLYAVVWARPLALLRGAWLRVNHYLREGLQDMIIVINFNLVLIAVYVAGLWSVYLTIGIIAAVIVLVMILDSNYIKNRLIPAVIAFFLPPPSKKQEKKYAIAVRDTNRRLLAPQMHADVEAERKARQQAVEELQRKERVLGSPEFRRQQRRIERMEQGMSFGTGSVGNFSSVGFGGASTAGSGGGGGGGSGDSLSGMSRGWDNVPDDDDDDTVTQLVRSRELQLAGDTPQLEYEQRLEQERQQRQLSPLRTAARAFQLQQEEQQRQKQRLLEQARSKQLQQQEQHRIQQQQWEQQRRRPFPHSRSTFTPVETAAFNESSVAEDFMLIATSSTVSSSARPLEQNLVTSTTATSPRSLTPDSPRLGPIGDELRRSDDSGEIDEKGAAASAGDGKEQTQKSGRRKERKLYTYSLPDVEDPALQPISALTVAEASRVSQPGPAPAGYNGASSGAEDPYTAAGTQTLAARSTSSWYQDQDNYQSQQHQQQQLASFAGPPYPRSEVRSVGEDESAFAAAEAHLQHTWEQEDQVLRTVALRSRRRFRQFAGQVAQQQQYPGQVRSAPSRHSIDAEGGAGSSIGEVGGRYEYDNDKYHGGGDGDDKEWSDGHPHRSDRAQQVAAAPAYETIMSRIRDRVARGEDLGVHDDDDFDDYHSVGYDDRNRNGRAARRGDDAASAASAGSSYMTVDGSIPGATTQGMDRAVARYRALRQADRQRRAAQEQPLHTQGETGRWTGSPHRRRRKGQQQGEGGDYQPNSSSTSRYARDDSASGAEFDGRQGGVVDVRGGRGIGGGGHMYCSREHGRSHTRGHTHPDADAYSGRATDAASNGDGGGDSVSGSGSSSGSDRYNEVVSRGRSHRGAGRQGRGSSSSRHHSSSRRSSHSSHSRHSRSRDRLRFWDEEGMGKLDWGGSPKHP